MMKNVITLIIALVFFVGCTKVDKTSENTMPPLNTPDTSANIVRGTSTAVASETEEQAVILEAERIPLINPDGATLRERFLPPDGFSRLESKKDSFAEFLQTLPVKPDGSKVKYFDGREKTRDVYMAVVDYSLGNRDLQQCADAVMRLRAEYLYASGQQEKISFNFVNGFTANFSKWADGYGISVDGNNVSWVKNNRNDDSYESFQKYLDIVYAYSSTLSLDKELVQKHIEDIAIGDVFIVGGSPGHCVIVVDMVVNETTGEIAFILAQSYMPAQDIQILKGNEEGSPWYSNLTEDKLITPEWTFEKTQLKTWE